MKGKYHEYKALEYLRSLGFEAIRVPASATGRQPLPDIIAKRDGKLYAIEVKSTKGNTVLIDELHLKKMSEFCRFFDKYECEMIALVWWRSDKHWEMYKLSDNKKKILIRHEHRDQTG